MTPANYWVPPVDIYHTGEHELVLKAELPDMSREEIDVWHTTLGLGGPLPNLPLFLGPDLSLRMDFEASYQETCERLRLVA